MPLYFLADFQMLKKTGNTCHLALISELGLGTKSQSCVLGPSEMNQLSLAGAVDFVLDFLTLTLLTANQERACTLRCPYLPINVVLYTVLPAPNKTCDN